MVRWRDLTKEEQLNFGNGCGPMVRFLRLPSFIKDSFPSCRQHDFYYSRGGWWFEKIHADLGFYTAMLDDTARYTGTRRFLYFLAATAYFLFVAVFGWFCFKYGGPYDKDLIITFDKIRKKHVHGR